MVGAGILILPTATRSTGIIASVYRFYSFLIKEFSDICAALYLCCECIFELSADIGS